MTESDRPVSGGGVIPRWLKRFCRTLARVVSKTDRAAAWSALQSVYRHMLGREATEREIAEGIGLYDEGIAFERIVLDIATREDAAIHRARRSEDDKVAFTAAIRAIYANFLGRKISQDEVAAWLAQYQDGERLLDILLTIDSSGEARLLRERFDLGLEPGLAVQLIFEIVLGFGATPRQITHARDSIASGGVGSLVLLTQSFKEAALRVVNRETGVVPNDPTSVLVHGVSERLTQERWAARTLELAGKPTPPETPAFSRFLFTSTAAPLVTIITSLYRGGRFIAPFLENITSQSIFRDHAELLIIDANSPENEVATAAAYLERFPNIRYKRFDERIGIYAAWNYGVRHARGAYCTNANLDDCRRADSLELQAATLDALPFVDVVYQDVLYSFEENMAFADIERYGFASSLPIVSRYSLMEFNCPHNGPMWRKAIHDDVGFFNEGLRSAADYEFWLRALLAGKTFYKLNDPHVGYYVNPDGLSTRPDTAGEVEFHAISKAFYRRMVSEAVTMGDADFMRQLSLHLDRDATPRDRYDAVQMALRQLAATARQSNALAASQ